MTVDLTKLNFYSLDPIDKVVSTDTVQVVNDGNTGTLYQSAKVVESTIANPYGRKAFVRAKWSVDGSGSNSLQTHLIYSFTVSTVPGDPGHPSSTTLSGLKGAVS